jgi:hypothetical protein
MYKQIILAKLLDYLKLKQIPLKKTLMTYSFKCPLCDSPNTLNATILPYQNKVNCYDCKPKETTGEFYTIVDIAKKLEHMENKSEDEILQYLKSLLNVKVLTKIDEDNIVSLLEQYEKWGFDLVPITANGKIPVENEWTKKSHKNIEEWNRWIKEGLNIGVKTGLISNITIIDIDQKPIPEEIKKMMGNPIIQESGKGFHLIYRYDSDLRKTRIDELKIDIENDGGQVVIYPSLVNDVRRKFIETPVEITSMPKELKAFLLSKITVPRQTLSEKLVEDIKSEDFNLGVLDEGGRNANLIRLGGILRKELNITQTGYVLSILNKHLCKEPLPSKEVSAMIKSLDRYTEFDEKELAHKVLEYLKYIEEANRTEIAMAVVGSNRGEEKKRVDKALAYLVKEGYITKHGRSYAIIKKGEWKDTLIDEGEPIDFQMPYFYDVANFNFGDLILIGSKNKRGKTHLSMNIVKQLVNQNLNPYYISLEAGSRFTKIALQLGMKEGDFKWTFCSDPTQIEIEPNAITIIDWLCPQNFAETDKIFMRFVEQLHKTNGVLIVFMQLKDDNTWFAPNMVKQFPSLACKYIYDNEDDGEYGKFKIEVIRDPKLRIKSHELPCRYNWETKELKRIDELTEEDTKDDKPTGYTDGQ